MKKLLITGALCALTILPAVAQESNQAATEKVEYSTEKRIVETAGSKANWFISAGFGGQVYFGDHDNQVKFGKRIAPSLDIAVGKWITPSVGFRIMYSGLSYKGATQDFDLTNNTGGVHSTGERLPGDKGKHGYWLDYQKFKSFTLGGDVMFNMSNILLGYKDKRVWNCSPYVGIGWARVYDAPTDNELLVRGGLFNAFSVCPALDINLDVKMGYVNDAFDGEYGGRSGEGLLAATVGISYKFKPRGWGRSKTVTKYDKESTDNIIAQLERIKAENEKLGAEAEQLRSTDPGQNIINVNKLVSSYEVFFAGNSDALPKEYQVNLGMFAELLKKSKSNVSLTSYVPEGAGADLKALAENRLEAVANCLVKEFGVSKKDIRTSVETKPAGSKYGTATVVVRGE
ncbi:MAG: OmpA family protein [Candidatus Cryptobacteroides sp.]